MPARKTTALKEKTASHAPAKHYPKLSAYLPPEPKWFDLLGNRRTAAEARRWWREIVPLLHGAGVLTKLDETLVVEAAVCAARIRECERELGRTGLLVDGARGGIVRNPIIMALSSYRQSLKSYLRELGLTPLSRQSLDAPRVTSESIDAQRKLRLQQACWAAGRTDIDFDSDDWDLDIPPEIWNAVVGDNVPEG